MKFNLKIGIAFTLSILLLSNSAYSQGVSVVKWLLLKDHLKPVTCIAFSPDGKFLATGGADQVTKLWSAENGSKIKTLRGHVAGVHALAYSSGGALIVTGSEDKTIKIWRISTMDVLQTMLGHTDWVTAITLSPDGNFIASGSKDQTVRIWLREKGSQIRSFKGHTGTVTGVAFTPDGEMLASGGTDNNIILWSTVTWKELRTLKGHTDGVASISISPDGKMLASSSYDKTIKLWSLETGEEISTLRKHTDWVRAVAFSPDGQLVVSCGRDGMVIVWLVETGAELMTFRAHTESVNDVAFSPDGKVIATASSDFTVRLWKFEGWGQFVVTNPGAPPLLSASMDFTEPTGNQFLDAEETGSLHLTVYNGGKGDAYNMKTAITAVPHSGTRISAPPMIYRLPAGSKRTIDIPVQANDKLKNGDIQFKAEIVEANGFDLENPAYLLVKAKEITDPNIVVEVGIEDESGNGQIEPREIVKMTARIRNKGVGDAWGVKAKVEVGENVFVTRGAETEFELGLIKPGEYRDIQYSVFTNNRTESVGFSIGITDTRERYNKVVPFNMAFYKPQTQAHKLK